MTTMKTMGESVPKNVNLFNIFLSQFGMITDAPKIAKGLFQLVTFKPNQKKSIGLLMEKQAQRYPDRPFLTDAARTLTYDEGNREINRIAHLLQKNGITAGSVVGIFLENRTELILTAIAAIKLGAIAAMMNTSQRHEGLLHSLRITSPSALIVGEELTHAIDEMHDQLPESVGDNLWFVADGQSIQAPDTYRNLTEEAAQQSESNPGTTQDIALHQTAFYVFTSGTTGLPKASLMSHYRWHKAMAGVGTASMRIRETDVFYCPLPLYHNNAITLTLSAVLGNGACLAIARKFSASSFWQDIRRYQATAFCYIGELCRYLYNQPAQPDDSNNSVRVVLGNGLRPDIWMAFKQRFGIKRINEFYGASEVNLLFTNALNLDCTTGCCPLPHAVVEWDVEKEKPVFNNKGFMTKVKTGQTGLLLAKVTDRSPFDGYTSNEATEKKLFRNVFTRGDCYINTGDLVIKQGWMHIGFADRLGDTFRWKGENVATAEIESVLNKFPGVEHAVVYGVTVPGTDGRAGMAALTLDCTIAELCLRDLTSYVRNELPTYAIPLFIRIREQQQLTSTFKAQKGSLKKEAFDIETIQEPVLTLLPEESRYQPLTDEIYQQINALKIRF